MLKTIALKQLNRTINKILATDPACFAELTALAGHCIAIEITSFSSRFYIAIHPNGIEISTKNQDSDLELIGSASALLRLAKTEEPIKMLMTKEVKLKGEIDFLLKLKHIRQQCELDIEALVAEYTGDFLANRLGMMARKLKEHLKYQQKRLGIQLTEYLQEEIKALPSQLEYEDFKQDLNQFRHELERFEAKLNHFSLRKTHG